MNRTEAHTDATPTRSSASSFAAGTDGTGALGSLGALAPSWFLPEDGSEPEPWLTADEAFERFLLDAGRLSNRHAASKRIDDFRNLFRSDVLIGHGFSLLDVVGFCTSFETGSRET